MRPYISRVENGHIVPRIEILKEWAGALGMPLYQFLYESEEPPKPLKLPEDGWGSSGREARELVMLRRSLSKMTRSRPKDIASSRRPDGTPPPVEVNLGSLL